MILETMNRFATRGTRVGHRLLFVKAGLTVELTAARQLVGVVSNRLANEADQFIWWGFCEVLVKSSIASHFQPEPPHTGSLSPEVYIHR